MLDRSIERAQIWRMRQRNLQHAAIVPECQLNNFGRPHVPRRPIRAGNYAGLLCQIAAIEIRSLRFQICP